MLRRISDKKVIKTIPLSECIAKTIHTENGVEKGISVFGHCVLAGLVARTILQRKPVWLTEKLFPDGTDLVVAEHDIGKVSPAFQEKIHYHLRTEEYPDGMSLGIGVSAALDDGGHAAVSQAALQNKGKFIAEIAGRHHGYSPRSPGLPNDEKYGGAEWQKQREQLFSELKAAFNKELPMLSSEVSADLISGLTCVADWLSSGSSFQQTGEHDLNDNALITGLINNVLDNAGMVNPDFVKGLSFKDIFGFEMRSIQNEFVSCVKGEGVYILEAPMGLGKTEAALFAAYKVIEEGRATGIYFALPTQLTSNKIYDRVEQFINKIVKPESRQKTMLLHNTAWLLKTDIGGEGAPGGSWFDNKKRGLLAPFGVGTIDQALMAAMNVKHSFVRTYGLAGKVVILDEVHCYDSYTGTILDTLIEILQQIGCTVIILSATLTTNRRNELLKIAAANETGTYPRISILRNKEFCEVFPEKSKPVAIQIHCESDMLSAVDEAIKRADEGQQVLWIENTVSDAQELYKLIGSRAQGCNIECGLLHSRFIKENRNVIESKWVNLYGNSAGSKRSQCGRILIGTQVLEQSLDIDADFLISRLAPSDMLFQRAGRLWRHSKNDQTRPVNAVREMWVLVPSVGVALESIAAFGMSSYVYSPYVLCRTLIEWEQLKCITLPDDISAVLNSTYSEKAETGLLQVYKQELRKRIEELQRFALIGISRSGITRPEIAASTRYAETESVDVLLLRSFRNIDEKTIRITLINGEEISFGKRSPTLEEKKKIAAVLLNNCVQVAEKHAPITNVKQIDWLKEYVYIGDEYDNPFRVAIVKKDGELVSIGNSSCGNVYNVSYYPTIGYVAKKVKND